MSLVSKFTGRRRSVTTVVSKPYGDTSAAEKAAAVAVAPEPKKPTRINYSLVITPSPDTNQQQTTTLAPTLVPTEPRKPRHRNRSPSASPKSRGSVRTSSLPSLAPIDKNEGAVLPDAVLGAECTEDFDTEEIGSDGDVRIIRALPASGSKSDLSRPENDSDGDSDPRSSCSCDSVIYVSPRSAAATAIAISLAACVVSPDAAQTRWEQDAVTMLSELSARPVVPLHATPLVAGMILSPRATYRDKFLAAIGTFATLVKTARDNRFARGVNIPRPPTSVNGGFDEYVELMHAILQAVAMGRPLTAVQYPDDMEPSEGVIDDLTNAICSDERDINWGQGIRFERRSARRADCRCPASMQCSMHSSKPAVVLLIDWTRYPHVSFDPARRSEQLNSNRRGVNKAPVHPPSP